MLQLDNSLWNQTYIYNSHFFKSKIVNKKFDYQKAKKYYLPNKQLKMFKRIEFIQIYGTQHNTRNIYFISKVFVSINMI